MSNKHDPSFYDHQCTAQQIRQHGALGTINYTLSIVTHDLPTRLMAWPGNGFQTQSLHALVLAPGMHTPWYAYQISEEALLCLRGSCQVYLHEQWVTLQPGDIAYFPAGISHAIKNETHQECVVITQLTPPVLELYAQSGFYDVQSGVFDHDRIMQAKNNIVPWNLSQQGEVDFHDTYPQLRAWNVKPEMIAQHGALFNMFHGATFTNLQLPMRLVLWPGYGTRLAGFHAGYQGIHNQSLVHTHPISDEVLFFMRGTHGSYYCQGQWIPARPNDYLLAPCGVPHGAKGPDSIEVGSTEPQCVIGGGFASPPQIDLYLKVNAYAQGAFSDLTSERLKIPQDN